MPQTRRSTAVATRNGLTSAPRAVNRMSTSELVAHHIRCLIFDGHLKQDDYIRQEELARQLGVSRSPVREAVIALSHEGWLLNELYRGAFVRGLEPSSVQDHYEVLGFVYGLAARHAVDRQTPEGVARLTAAQGELEAAQTPLAMRQTSDAYLTQLCAMAESPTLSTLARSLEGNVVPGNFFEFVPAASAIHKRGTALITKGVRALQSQDAELACRDLLRRHGDKVVALLNARRR